MAGAGAMTPVPAPMGPRAGAAIIDFIILIVVNGVLLAIFDMGAAYVLGIIIFLAYFIGLEATQGKTLGKMALGLRVVTQDGQPLDWGPSAIRNVLRIIDGILLYLVGFIIAMTNDRRQRLGDMAAKTMVIKE